MGKIMKNSIQYGVGGITNASDIKYGSTDVESALNDLNTGLATLINVDYSTITTSASGSANLNVPSGRRVFSAASTNGDYVVIPVMTGVGQTWVKVFNWSMTPIENTEVTIRYYYIKTTNA